ncbi:acetylxylan esterase [Streptomyces albogriseolus]
MPAFDLPPAQLESHRPDVTEPADFDAFWKRTLDQAEDAGDAVVSAEPVDSCLRLTETWDVTFRGFAGDPVRAWFSRPARATAPFRPWWSSRGTDAAEASPRAADLGERRVRASADGQPRPGRPVRLRRRHPDPHAGAPGGPGPAVRGLLDPRDYHYRRLITDAVRAVDAVRALPGVDASRVAAVGNSQGGGLALAVAGLVPDLAAVLVTAPFLCGIRRALDLTDLPPYGEISAYLAVHRGAEEAAHRTLGHVEGISFARRAHAPAHFGVGLRDTVCPPSGTYAAFNRYAELSGGRPSKVLHAYPYNGHEGGDAVHVRRQLGWAREVLGS